MKLDVLSCAEVEFVEAVIYYNDQFPGLGYEFAAEIQRTFDRIQSFPEAWPKLSSRSHRCIVDRFPYAVIYQVRKECILVGGIMHLKRNPRLWQDHIHNVFGDDSPLQ